MFELQDQPRPLDNSGLQEAIGPNLRDLRGGQEPCCHLALSLDIDSGFRIRIDPSRVRRSLAKLGSAGHTGRFHAGRDIHRIAPDIIEEFLHAHYAGNNRPAGDANSDRHVTSLWIVNVPCRIKHFESELNKSRGVIRSRHGHAAYNHVVIARSFDLLESVALIQP